MKWFRRDRAVLALAVGFCLGLAVSSRAGEMEQMTIDFNALVRAITAVESGGNPRAVGTAGERGLMQIKGDTWREVTQKQFGERIPFTRAFEPELNQQVGLAYLEQLATRLTENRERWKDSLLPLVVASFHRGPNCLESHGFSTRRLPREARDYVQRVINLHDLYASEARLLAMQTPDLRTSVNESVTSAN